MSFKTYLNRFPTKVRSRRAEARLKLDLIYDREYDAAYLRFSSEKVLESSEVAPGVMIGYDASGRMVSIEILHARKMLPLETLSAAE